MLFFISFLIHQSFDSGFNLFTTITYLLHFLLSLSRYLSWISSFSATIRDISTVSRWISNLSNHSLTWRPDNLNSFSAAWSRKFSRRLFYLSTVISTSSVLNWLVWIYSLSNIIYRVISFHSWNDFHLILSLRMHLSLRLLRRTSQKGIF